MGVLPNDFCSFEISFDRDFRFIDTMILNGFFDSHGGAKFTLLPIKIIPIFNQIGMIAGGFNRFAVRGGDHKDRLAAHVH